ncbi:MAG: putative non-canonical purine NTP phosphatase [Promethearchaeota archaeon]|nr:MAG: putative non-canonical purine NTP phosphatase [Candidatus Lokiarchaeota archaeon]
MHVCVGSLNPVKYSAVKKAFKRYYRDFNLYKIKTYSGVSNQPIGLEIILEGALNRAKQALNYLKTQKHETNQIYGVGIEAGLGEVLLAQSKYMDFQYCIILDEHETITMGSGIGFEYPKNIIEQIFKQNKEIGEIIGKMAKNKNLKTEKGAIGYLSHNVIVREDILTQAVICALLPRINQNLYSKG